jgi:hypothetical protein
MQSTQTLTLIDHENLSKGMTRTSEGTHTKRLRLQLAMEPLLRGLLGDLGRVVVGSSFSGPDFMDTMACFPGRQCIYEEGADGAERALIAHLEKHYSYGEISELIIASGDGIFVETARAWKARGTKIIVVSARGSLSHELRDLADEVHVLPSNWHYDFAA